MRYGTRVDHGFFPVFSVKEEEDAKLLVEALPWACTDSLTTYARRLESMSDEVIGARHADQTEEFLAKLEAEREMGEIKTKLMDLGRKLNDEVFVKSQSEDELNMLRDSFQEGVDRLQALVEENQKPNPIAQAIMEASE